MYLHRIPAIVQRGLSRAIWTLPGDNAVYLTFDDGPCSASEQLLDLLESLGVQASFFVLGEQAERYPDSMARLLSSWHTLGNHGYKHLNGWSTETKAYLENVAQGKSQAQSNLFRPPYGRMSPRQWRNFPLDQHIVMWSHMPGDFDKSLSDEQCVAHATAGLSDGSIIVLHDNEACINRVLRILPPIVEAIKKEGFQLKALPPISQHMVNT